MCRRADFTSPARHRGDGGASRETDSIFSTLRARRAGHGARVRARLSTDGPRLISRRPRRATPRSALRGRRENGPTVEKNTMILCYTGLPFGEWDVSRGVTQVGMPHGKVVDRHPAVLVALGSFLTSATFRDKLALGHIFFITRFLVTNRDAVLSRLCPNLFTSSRFVTNITSLVDSGENITFLDTSCISLGMIKASNKRQQVTLQYV